MEGLPQVRSEPGTVPDPVHPVNPVHPQLVCGGS